MMTIVAILCHLVSGITDPVCHEEVLFRRQPMQACMVAEFGIAQWKENSRYAGTEWVLAGWKCVGGSYEAKDAT